MPRFAAKLCLALAMLLAANSVEAAVYPVTKTADTNDGACNADCSLREAVGAANATTDNDSVVFDPIVFSTPQTITLSGSEIVISNNGTFTLIGPGFQNLTISANGLSRVFTVGRSAIAGISGITVTGGNGVGAADTGRGGAIYNVGGTTVISDSVITGSTATLGGGAMNNASSNSPTPAVPGILTINNCTVSNNSSISSGGAIQNFSTSTITIINSTFTGNTSTGGVGGGAIAANGGLRVTNSTFTGNTATTDPGGAIQSNGTLGLVLTNVTITGNTAATSGGGLHRGTTNVNSAIRNSIIAGNTGGASPDVSNSAGGLDSQGNNIIGSVGTSTGWEATDLLNTNPMLGMLANNGGFGMTFLPMAGSPAIDAGQNCVLDLSCSANNPPQAVTTDQRGITRPQGPTVDIGSVEVAPMQANATVIGRVLTSAGPVGQGVFRGSVTIIGPGVNQTALTNNFGYFTFTLIPTGQTYTLIVSSKQYTFGPRQVTVNGDVTDITITPQGPSLWIDR